MERHEIAENLKWKITDIFPSDEAWEEAFASGEALATYLKENLTAGYMLTNGAVAA